MMIFHSFSFAINRTNLLSRPSKSNFNLLLATMAEQISSASAATTKASVKKKKKSSSLWPSVLQWIPTSTDHIIAAERCAFCLMSRLPILRKRWFCSVSNETRFVNMVTFDSKEGSPILVMIHGYAASQGFSSGTLIFLPTISKSSLGWGGSSRPDFTCKSTEETEAWFIDSLEEWCKSKNLSNFILLGHSFGGGLGPWGPHLVRRYTTARFGTYSTGDILSEVESKLLTDYVYHTIAAKASGQLCLKYIFSFGAIARSPLLHSTSEWKVPTSFIYGFEDWMNYQGAQEARKTMNVQCDTVRVPQGGYFVFLDNPMVSIRLSCMLAEVSSHLTHIITLHKRKDLLL